MRRLFLLFLLCASQPLFAEVNAYLDRYSVRANDTVRLTIEAIQTNIAQRPDLSGLSKNFQVLGSKKFTISNSRLGNRQSTTRWQVLLRPKASGELKLPAFVINGEKSLPLSLQVIGYVAPVVERTASAAPVRSELSPASTNTPPAPARMRPAVASSTGSGSKALFLKSKINYSEAYVGSQLVYTTELYHQQPLGKNATVSEPYLDKALMIVLDQPTTTKQQVRNETYSVTRQNFLIFPDAVGSHIIEAPVFSGTTLDGHYYETPSKPIELDILAPANSNASGYWLPSTAISIIDEFDQEKSLYVGNTIKRTIKLTAQGIPAARIPALSVLKNELATLERIDVELDETFNEQGLTSTRTETIEISFFERGEVTLPPIDVHWWNIETDQAQVAALPSRIFRISPAPVVKPDSAKSPASTIQAASAELAETQTAENSSENTGAEFALLSALLILISIAASVGWWYTYKKLKRTKQANKRNASEQTSRQQRLITQHLIRAEESTFQALVTACRQSDAVAAQVRLVEWAKCFWPDAGILHCKDIAKIAKNQTIEFLIIDLEQHLYSNRQGLWQGDLLHKAINTLRNKKQQKTEH